MSCAWAFITTRHPAGATGTSPPRTTLETWSDARAFDGTITIQQPLIEPLYNGRTAHEILSILLAKPDASPHEIVKGYWQGHRQSGNFDTMWQTSLHNGTVARAARAWIAECSGCR